MLPGMEGGGDGVGSTVEAVVRHRLGKCSPKEAVAPMKGGWEWGQDCVCV